MKFRKPLLIAGIWTILGLIYSSQSFFYSLTVGRSYAWQTSLFHSLVFCIEWGLLTPVVLSIAGRFRLDSKNFPKHLLIHIVIGGGVALLQHTFYVFFTDFIEGGFTFRYESFRYIASIIGYVEYGVLMYWSIVFVDHAVRYYRQYQNEEKNAAELRTQLAESQLQALKMQLQPHFLFNTLNAISVLVKKEPSLAQKMIVRLSDLLRLTLERGNGNVVSLDQELEFLNTYLAIEKVRFGDRLSVKMDVDEAALTKSVPTFILQPLVENSIRHGIAQRSGEGWINVRASVAEKTVTLSVSDGGVKAKKVKKDVEGNGVGLENTRARLRQLYGNDHRFDHSVNDENGFSVTITIPAVEYEGE